ncbi:MAG: thioredoxin family protein [Sphingobacteriaceae bacterium]|nr:thioredoxin family protein [Sphingobacteriaceae bacterium]
MKWKVIFGLIAVSVLLFYSFSNYSELHQDDEKPITLLEFNKKIKESEKIVLVYFHASWCTVCKKVKPVLAELENEFSEKVEVFRIDTDRDKEVAHEFDIHALPVMMLYNHANREWIHVGIISKGDLKQKIVPYTWDKKSK